MRAAKKTASTIEHHDDDTLIVHRSGRGFFGHVATWSAFYGDESSSAVSPGRKTLKTTKTFAVFHLLRNAFFWQLAVPLTFLVLCILNTADVVAVFGPTFSAAEELSSIRSENITTAANGTIISSSNATLHPGRRSSGPFWSHAATSSVLLLLAALAACIFPRLVSPLLFSERGHRSDLRLPIDIVNHKISVDSSSRSAKERRSASAPPPPAQGEETVGEPSTPALLAMMPEATVKEHVPFRRIPLTPKAIGTFFMVILHPFVHYIMLFSNSSLALFPADVALHPHSRWYSPMSVVSGWLSFDFIRYQIADRDVGCGIGRSYFWIVAIFVFVLFYFVLVGIFWSMAQMHMMREGKAYKKTFMWSIIWSVALVGFPMWYRELFSAFGCRTLELTTETTAVDNVTKASTVTKTSELVAVSLLCPTARCFSSSGHTAYAATAFVIFFLTFPILLVMHTQLRRLSISPRMEHGEKMGPLPRVDGLHLYVLLLSRFVVSALSGALGSVQGLAVAALVFDCMTLFFYWFAPCFSNIYVLNTWWRRFTVPACVVTSLSYAIWAAVVFNTMENAMKKSSSSGALGKPAVVSDAVVNLGAVIEVGSFLVVLVLFASTYLTHMKEHKLMAPRSVNSGGVTVDGKTQSQLLASIFHLPSGISGESNEPLIGGVSTSPSPSSPVDGGGGGAVGQAIQSTKVARAEQDGFSPRANDNDDDDDDYNHQQSSSPLPRFSAPNAGESDDGEDDVEHLSRSASLRGRSLRVREIRLKDEPEQLFESGKKEDSGADLHKIASSLEIDSS